MELFVIIVFFIAIITIVQKSLGDVQNPSSRNMNRVSNFGRSSYPKRSQSFKEANHAHHEPRGNFETAHADRIGRNLIKHEDPEPGYVILNGKKRRISDCRNL